MPLSIARLWAYPLDYPHLSLFLYYFLWKALLFAIAVISPGIGYDTSTTLLHSTLRGISYKFVRWDAIYYTETARRGYLFEQEWAFGWGYTRVVAFLTKCNILSKLAVRSILLTI